LIRSSCPQCGAVLDEGNCCQSIFDEFLILEFGDAGFGAVHMLTVACFMIQHERYSDEALIWIEKKLHEHLEEGRPVELIRQQAANEANQARRTWKVTRQPGARQLPRIKWSMTIADVASTYQNAEDYRELVQHWAQCTLREMQPLLPQG